VDCGGGGTSGGCRLLQVLFWVLTCRFVKKSVCVNLNNICVEDMHAEGFSF